MVCDGYRGDVLEGSGGGITRQDLFRDAVVFLGTVKLEFAKRRVLCEVEEGYPTKKFPAKKIKKNRPT